MSEPNDNAASRMTGLVTTRARQGVLVLDDLGKLHWCRVPGKGTLLRMPAPGDQVQFEPSTSTNDGRIEKIEPRKTLLKRFSYDRVKEIAANMDQVVFLATPDQPPVSPRLVDRMLVGASAGGLETIIAINKSDLFEPELLREYALHWEKVCPVVTLSAKNADGLEPLKELLKGRVTLLAGASGVGKSTLLNTLIHTLRLDTAAVSMATKRGVHTTAATILYPWPGGGIVADTPGVREFYPVLDDPDELALHFADFAPYREQCRYDDCNHLPDSPECAVLEAAENGRIHPARYESYLLLRASLLAGPRRGRGEMS